MLRASLVSMAVLCACQAPPPPPPAPSRQLLEVRGTQLFVERLGRGEPILVVHGGPMLDHGYLLPHLAPLADAYELIFYDQRLCGRSAPTAAADSVSIASFVEDIEALRASLGLGRVHLLAHSFGGLLAQHYAIAHGDRLRSLVLLDSMAASSALWQQESARGAQMVTAADRAHLAELRDSEGFVARQPAAIAAMLRASFAVQFHDRSHLDELALFVPDDYVARSDQFAAIGPDLMDYDLHAELRRVTVPALVLYGAAEPGAEIGGPELRAALPGASWQLIADAGHFPFIEQPQAFLRVLRAFLAGVPDR